MVKTNKKIKTLSKQQRYNKKMVDNNYLPMKTWVHVDDIDEFNKNVNALPGRKNMKKK